MEAAFREADCAALLHVARKRAARSGKTWAEMIVAYSALKSDTPRAREVRSYPAGNHPGKSESWNRRWARQRAFAAAVMRGEVPDPCARATHWGARNLPRDVERAERAIREGRWLPARCAVETRNAFYEVLPKWHLTSKGAK